MPAIDGGLAADALLDVAVAADRVDVVVERRGALGGVRVEQAALAAGGHRHADRVGDALAERAGRGLDAGGVAVLRVARGLAAPGAQRLEVLELEAPAAEEELEVERDRAVARGEHEAVAAGPARVGGVVPHHLLEEQVRHGREAHGGARVAVADLLHRVHGEGPDRCPPPSGRRRSSPAQRLCSRGSSRIAAPVGTRDGVNVTGVGTQAGPSLLIRRDTIEPSKHPLMVTRPTRGSP